MKQQTVATVHTHTHTHTHTHKHFYRIVGQSGERATILNKIEAFICHAREGPIICDR